MSFFSNAVSVLFRSAPAVSASQRAPNTGFLTSKPTPAMLAALASAPKTTTAPANVDQLVQVGIVDAPGSTASGRWSTTQYFLDPKTKQLLAREILAEKMSGVGGPSKTVEQRTWQGPVPFADAAKLLASLTTAPRMAVGDVTSNPAATGQTRDLTQVMRAALTAASRMTTAPANVDQLVRVGVADVAFAGTDRTRWVRTQYFVDPGTKQLLAREVRGEQRSGFFGGAKPVETTTWLGPVRCPEAAQLLASVPR